MIRLNQAGKVIVLTILIIWAIGNLFPIAVMIVSGFKTSRDIFLNPFGLPKTLSFATYVKAWNEASFSVYFTNSIIVTVTSIAGILFFSSMMAYVLARFDFPGRRFVYLFVLMGLVLPVRLAIIPIFLLMRSLHLNNTRIGLFLVYSAGGISFSTFLLVNFFRTVETDLEDAARIDGAGTFRIYWQINLPILRPALATVAVFNFINVWNDFFFPLILIDNNAKKTIPLGVQNFFGEYSIQWDMLFAGLNIAVIPVIVFFVILSKQFTSGLAEGALK
ncbi:MAG TPA: carbohydrate ABC transporter permease [Spirochaetia bacterium]|nr:carbohydrate ABC transporter permease [Spirochaetia bacterium]